MFRQVPVVLVVANVPVVRVVLVVVAAAGVVGVAVVVVGPRGVSHQTPVLGALAGYGARPPPQAALKSVRATSRTTHVAMVRCRVLSASWRPGPSGTCRASHFRVDSPMLPETSNPRGWKPAMPLYLRRLACSASLAAVPWV